MVRPVLLILLLALGPLTGRVAAAELTLVPPSLDAGQVAVLLYVGPRPQLAVARFSGRIIYLTPTEQGGVALLGADLDMPPGDYPLTLAVSDRRGATRFLRRTVAVRAVDRAEERLQLPDSMVRPRKPEVLERIARERRRLQAIFARQTPGLAVGPFARPVTDPVSSPFGLRRVLTGRPRAPHGGVDFRSRRGTAVRAPAAGTVVLANDLFFTGRTIMLDHGEGLFSLFAHLQSSEMKPGDRVSAGDVVGKVGSSGRSTGPHLHWSVRLRGDRVDPLSLVAVAGKTLDSMEPAGNN
jgi:murein DD-endopeptidase MepM/ murein hydrolase activator NlpD